MENYSKLEKRYAFAHRKPFVSDADFKESDHPRDDDGKFGSGGGSSSERKPDRAESNLHGEKRWKSLESELNRAKEKDLSEKRANEKQASSTRRNLQSAWKEHKKGLTSHFAKKLGKADKEVEKHLDLLRVSKPELFSKILNEYLGE